MSDMRFMTGLSARCMLQCHMKGTHSLTTSRSASLTLCLSTGPKPFKPNADDGAKAPLMVRRSLARPGAGVPRCYCPDCSTKIVGCRLPLMSFWARASGRRLASSEPSLHTILPEHNPACPRLHPNFRHEEHEPWQAARWGRAAGSLTKL